LNEPLSFDAFFAAESQTLFRRMWLVTRDRHEAEEIVQDAFLRLFERWDRATSWEDPTSYLYRTAFKRSLTWRRLAANERRWPRQMSLEDVLALATE
jgi:RNA polymerase sigma-70 factor (ECF subfamily)